MISEEVNKCNNQNYKLYCSYLRSGMGEVTCFSRISGSSKKCPDSPGLPPPLCIDMMLGDRGVGADLRYVMDGHGIICIV